ncbi:MAG: hypothetical protein ACJAVR_002501 [Paracoccaceae bacterium]|jgi:hypothetical protein
MIRILVALITLSPAIANAAAAAFERPVPQAQSATAEIWFAAASLAMIAALYAVHRLVTRR